MLIPFLLLAQLQAGNPLGQGAPATHDGRANQLAVRPPRVEAEIRVDGVLDEPVWSSAARLTGFSQFSPIDGVPAEDSTEVLVWYSPTAIHFGIRAHERHGAVNATLAERDRILSDDHVQVLLGTFNDGRQATVFGVNPLGVQLDGTLVESNQNRSGNNFGGPQAARDQADLSPDFVFQSKGRVMADGYEIELRIPFKSLRYQPGREQSWSVNVVRRVQHSGAEDSWSPARRASASFLAQSGTLEGLTELRRGLVLDVNPVVTQRTVGSRSTAGAWGYDGQRPEAGGNLRWGVTNNLTLNAAANPDFAEVESDAGQFNFDPRASVFFPEKRPFFLEGNDLFATPGNLVYTRRIADPVAAAKLAGKVSGTNVALLTAVDDERLSLGYTGVPGEGSRPVFAVARLQRDLGAQSRIGATLTGREDGRFFNRVADVDGRLVFRRLYSISAQAAVSRTRQPLSATRDTVMTGPLWQAGVSRNGRQFGFTYSLNGNDESFRTLSGFVNRRGVAYGNVDHRFTRFHTNASFVQSVTLNPVVQLTWLHDRFEQRRDAIEKKLHLNTNAQLRGGWSAGASVLFETFGFDPSFYASRGYRILRAEGDTLPFVGVPRLFNRDYLVTVNTPQFRTFNAGLFYLWGQDENFSEWSSGDIRWLTASANWRPTGKLRTELRYNLTTVHRSSDGTRVESSSIPRLKMEYQLTRAIFVRLVGEHNTYFRDALRDDTRTEAPLLVGGRRTYAFTDAGFRGDALFAYQPTPGTVLFAGYGSSYAGFETDEPLAERTRASDLQRTGDAVFVKLSYLFRL